MGKRRMKILVISHMYPSTFNDVAGIFVHEQVKALVKQGCEVRVISPVPWAPFPLNKLTGKWKAYYAIPAKLILDGVTVYYPRYTAFPKDLLFASSGERAYRRFKNLVGEIYRGFQFDLIHAHVALPSGFAAALLAKDYRTPMVVTIHGQDLYRTIHKDSVHKKAIADVFANADKVITVSTKLKDIAVNELGFADKIAVIGNGVSLDGFDEGIKTQPVDGTTILSASYLIPRKGIEYNIKAVANLVEKHPGITYRIVGDGPEMGRLKGLASSLGLDGRVEFLGRSSHRDVLQEMSRADVFSLPSWNEAFGVVYVEAMALGKPVVACRGEGIEDVARHGATCLLAEPQDVDSLTQALDYLLSHPEEARAMGARARELVLTNYTWEKIAERMIELYEEVLG